jgi:hypothetical protein
MDHPTNPFFNIPDGMSYYCTILLYARGHSHLEIEISNGQDTKYLVFEGVDFFSGPMRWRGTTFALAPVSECLNILHELGWYSDFPDDYLSSKFHLFVLDTSNSSNENLPVRILAQAAGLSNHKSAFAPDSVSYSGDNRRR